MKHIRLIVIWAVLASVAVLIFFSIFGAFVDSGVLSRSLVGRGILWGFVHAGLLDAAAADPAEAGDRGVELARGMFNSLPMVGYWIFVTVLLLVGLLFFKRLVRCPGLLAAHVGCVLVLVGAMIGSPRGHALAAKHLETAKIPSGYMQIYEGQAHGAVAGVDGRMLGTLPFQIRLEDFWIEYYEPPEPWILAIDCPLVGDEHRRRIQALAWKVGQEIAVPFTDARLKVLQFLPGAKPTYAPGAEPLLEVTDAEGNKTTVPARLGREVPVKSPKGVLRIRHIFSSLLVRDGMAEDRPGSGHPPALELAFEGANGKKGTRWAYPRHVAPAHHTGKGGMRLLYVLPEPTGAAPDPGGKRPAIEVLMTHRGRELREWLLAEDPNRGTAISLASLLPPPAPTTRDAHGPDARCGHGHDDNVYLRLIRRWGPIRDFKSRLAVMEEGRTVRRKEIEVNYPLHYGGYHFYQHFYDTEEGRYTILSVRSDSGLWVVYVGFVLVCAGIFWLFWAQPAFRYLTRSREGRNDGD